MTLMGVTKHCRAGVLPEVPSQSKIDINVMFYVRGGVSYAKQLYLCVLIEA